MQKHVENETCGIVLLRLLNLSKPREHIYNIDPSHTTLEWESNKSTTNGFHPADQGRDYQERNETDYKFPT